MNEFAQLRAGKMIGGEGYEGGCKRGVSNVRMCVCDPTAKSAASTVAVATVATVTATATVATVAGGGGGGGDGGGGEGGGGDQAATMAARVQPWRQVRMVVYMRRLRKELGILLFTTLIRF